MTKQEALQKYLSYVDVDGLLADPDFENADHVVVELEDGAGGTSSMNVNILDTIPDIYPSIVGGHDTTSAIFKTFRLPIVGFAADGVAIDMSNILKVRFKFAEPGTAGQGRIAIDDLEVER